MSLHREEWLAKLIAFDTTSRNSNLPLIDEIQKCFAHNNIEYRLTYDSSRKKANIFGILPAENDSINHGIVLSGHTDVVPVDGQKWETDPFVATTIDDRIYGRGTADMKGFIAVVLALIPELIHLPRTYPLYFAFSYDEEVGCIGAPGLIADMQQYGIQPKACIVGEPTEMHPVTAHKGITLLRCRVRGQATHSSLTPQGCNAIDYAASLICKIREIADQIRVVGPFDEFYDVPFTSVSTNTIQGGNAINTIPAGCEFFFEIRNLPSSTPKKILDEVNIFITEILLPKMRKESQHATIEIEQMAAAPGLDTSEQTDLIKLARMLTNENQIRKVAYATEAGLFQQAGIPTIICGPGNIEQAHRANEFVTRKQLELCETFLRHLVKRGLE